MGEIRREGIDMNGTVEISIEQADSFFGNMLLVRVDFTRFLCHAGKQFSDLFDIQFFGRDEWQLEGLKITKRSFR